MANMHEALRQSHRPRPFPIALRPQAPRHSGSSPIPRSTDVASIARNRLQDDLREESYHHRTLPVTVDVLRPDIAHVLTHDVTSTSVDAHLTFVLPCKVLWDKVDARVSPSSVPGQAGSGPCSKVTTGSAPVYSASGTLRVCRHVSA